MNQVTYKGKWSFPIYRDFVLNPDISVLAKMIYISLKSFCSPGGNTSFPSSVKLSKSLGISRETFYKYCRELEAHGLLKRKQHSSDSGKFTNTIYTIYPTKTVSESSATV